ncbi:MAG TPA: ribosomal protein S18-alanine N-acetyltransferase [Firmicutes bacterium]|nr:ribosomal protein S18-alanine N-acetyltransferase [Bacillota bacterium]
MTLADLDGVMAVEEVSYPTPWSRRAFIGELTENVHAHYIVARNGWQVVGYAGMWVILDEAHVTNIAVHPDWRRCGLGERLLRELIARARARGATRVTLEVRKSNFPAQHLYTKMGFVPRGIRRGYYSDTHEDAIIMWLDDLGDENH